MDRENVTRHTSYHDARNEAIDRIGLHTPERARAGFYHCITIENDEAREVYIIRERTVATGFHDLWEDQE